MHQCRVGERLSRDPQPRQDSAQIEDFMTKNSLSIWSLSNTKCAANGTAPNCRGSKKKRRRREDNTLNSTFVRRRIQQTDDKYNLEKCFLTVRFSNRKLIVASCIHNNLWRHDDVTGDSHRVSLSKFHSAAYLTDFLAARKPWWSAALTRPSRGTMRLMTRDIKLRLRRTSNRVCSRVSVTWASRGAGALLQRIRVLRRATRSKRRILGKYHLGYIKMLQEQETHHEHWLRSSPRTTWRRWRRSSFPWRQTSGSTTWTTCSLNRRSRARMTQQRRSTQWRTVGGWFRWSSIPVSRLWFDSRSLS